MSTTVRDRATNAVANFVSRFTLSAHRPRAEPILAAALLDTVGVSLAAQHTSAVQAVRRFTGAGSQLGADSAASDEERATAALVGGTAAHALDFDDYGRADHASAVLIPALLALGPGGAHADPFADAYAAGYEVWDRIGGLTDEHYARGFHTTATVGSLGAACAAARFLGFDARQSAAALGIAASLAGGLQSGYGSDVKPLHAGFAASAGVRAALLVRAGLRAPTTTLDVAGGFLAAFVPDTASQIRALLENLDGVLDDSGSAALLARPPAAKAYPCCGATHGAIDAALRLRAEISGADPAAPDRVVVVTPEVCYPQALRHHSAQTGLEAKFCMEYCVAVAFVHGEVTLEHFRDEAVRDWRVQDVMSRVVILRERGLDQLFHAGMLPARVQVTYGGRDHVLQVDDPIGGQTNPMQLPQIAAKFALTTRGVLDARSITRLCDTAGSLSALLGAVLELRSETTS